MIRPLFLPASAPCYAAWWEHIDGRLARAKAHRAIWARRAARTAEQRRAA